MPKNTPKYPVSIEQICLQELREIQKMRDRHELTFGLASAADHKRHLTSLWPLTQADPFPRITTSIGSRKVELTRPMSARVQIKVTHEHHFEE